MLHFKQSPHRLCLLSLIHLFVSPGCGISVSQAALGSARAHTREHTHSQRASSLSLTRTRDWNARSWARAVICDSLRWTAATEQPRTRLTQVGGGKKRLIWTCRGCRCVCVALDTRGLLLCVDWMFSETCLSVTWVMSAWKCVCLG